MIRNLKSFDFFISYAGPDLTFAKSLRDSLQSVALVFLAPESELLGDDWPTRLPETIRDTWVTLAIISRYTPAAHFQREEIILALKESRSGFHAIIPIRLAVRGEIPRLPFGLNSKNCLDFYSGSQDEIDSAIDRLLAAKDDIRSRAGLVWRTSREAISQPELTLASSDPLRNALERVKTYEQGGLFRERTVEEIQLILLKYYLIGDEQGY
ncbi:MAG: toll/interleukin-1 receptor domain-containing protein [Acidobacteria bacterium]|nr:toll/interleukin-1 receptor domain-containing protein [Acidobacteriota bacterium]